MGGLLIPEYDGDEIAAWTASAPLTEGVLTPFGQVDPAWLSQDGTISIALGLERTKNWADSAAEPARGTWSPPDQLRRLAQDGRTSTPVAGDGSARVMITFSSAVLGFRER